MIKLAIKDRKAVALRLAEITGEESWYTKVPRCAYEVGPYVIEKDGSVTTVEGTDLQPLRELVEEGMIKPFSDEEERKLAKAAQARAKIDEAPEPKEPVRLSVSVPMKDHTANSLRNLINLIYTRAGLLNKALGTSFRVDEKLIENLRGDHSIDEILEVANDEEMIEGLHFTPEKITLTMLSDTEDPDRLQAFTVLCEMMNKQALSQKRIQAKLVNNENEKYAFRIWLVRLGMNGPKYKKERRVLMENLTGNAAFRTPEKDRRVKAPRPKYRRRWHEDAKTEMEAETE